MRRIADFVIKSPPSADFGPARSVDGRHWNLAHCLGNTGGELLAFAAGLRATRWAAKGGPMLFMIVERFDMHDRFWGPPPEGGWKRVSS